MRMSSAHYELMRRAKVRPLWLAVMVALVAALFVSFSAFGQGNTGTGGPVSRGDLLKQRQYKTAGTLTFYVDAAGNDSNDCQSLASPCLTITGVRAKLPKLIADPVTINVGAGTFSGTNLNIFQFAEPTQGAATGMYLNIVGTLANSTSLASGTATGTATAGAAASWPSFATLTDAAQTWTVNNLRGRFLTITSGSGSGNTWPIISNTATVITVAGNPVTLGAGSVYAIQDSTTVMSGLSPLPATPSLATQANYAVFVTEGVGQTTTLNTSAFRLAQMRFTNATGRAVALFGAGTLQMSLCQFAGSSASAAIASNGTQGSWNVNMDRIAIISSGSGPFWQHQNSTIGGRLAIQNSMGFGVSLFGTVLETQLSITGSSFFGSSTANAALIPIARGDVTMQLTALDCQSTSGSLGLVYRFSSTAPLANYGNVTSNTFGNVSISNCVTGIQVSGNGSTLLFTTGVVSGTGNTTAMSVLNGGTLSIEGDTTLTGTTELSIDGTAYTLAALRAMTPKRITDLATGSTIVEP